MNNDLDGDGENDDSLKNTLTGKIRSEICGNFKQSRTNWLLGYWTHLMGFKYPTAPVVEINQHNHHAGGTKGHLGGHHRTALQCFFYTNLSFEEEIVR